MPIFNSKDLKSRKQIGNVIDRPLLKLLQDNVAIKFLSTKVAGGFAGAVFALYATSSGQLSTNKAAFKYLDYSANDLMYKTTSNTKK